MTVVGWDIGGSNTKAARVEQGAVVAALSRPFELRLDPAGLVPLLRALARDLGRAPRAHAVTMTAELARNFQTKREGVAFVLDAVEDAFPAADVRVFTTDGSFVSPAEARPLALRVASANWVATAMLVAQAHQDAVLIDIGTTTTDIIPIVGGRVVAAGRTDPQRLASGELVYTGALRTPAEALAPEVLIAGERVGVAAEGFAVAGDVHLWRGDLCASDYTIDTPDGRSATREHAGDRLRRLVCADRDLLGDAGVTDVADALAHAQIARVASAVRRVAHRHPPIRSAVVAGLGAFVAARAAGAAGLDVVRLDASCGPDAARCAPAAAVARLLDARLGAPAAAAPPRGLAVPTWPARRAGPRRGECDVVVKVGGALLSHPDLLSAVLDALSEASRTQRILVVPGGGPFADAVRDADRRVGLGDDAAHWMAVLAMDQYAELLASKVERAARVTSLQEAGSALAAGRLAVLAPYGWLRAADPLPHSWDITSDSIAAWVAGQAGAPALVLIKPPAASGRVVDPYFERVLPRGTSLAIVHGDRVEALRRSLDAGGRATS